MQGLLYADLFGSLDPSVARNRALARSRFAWGLQPTLVHITTLLFHALPSMLQASTWPSFLTAPHTTPHATSRPASAVAPCRWVGREGALGIARLLRLGLLLLLLLLLLLAVAAAVMSPSLPAAC